MINKPMTDLEIEVTKELVRESFSDLDEETIIRIIDFATSRFELID